MTKGDVYTKEIIRRILTEGRLDKDPRPKYIDGTPAHTLSINHGMCTYDLSKGESPLITLRPIATKTSINEMLWIYQQESNDLVLFDKFLNKNTWDENHQINNWWDEWAIRDKDGNYVLNEAGHPTIGACYGETVRRHNLMKDLINEIRNNPDGRRHIINMWQVEDFKEPHGLKPCAFQTVWNVRHEDGEDYLDMCLFQRSSDFMMAGCINQVQYSALLCMIAKHLGYTPGRFTWFYDNIQIYDRHVDGAKEMLEREPIDCNPHIKIDDNITDFYDMTADNVKIDGYPMKLVKEKNPQISFEIAI